MDRDEGKYYLEGSTLWEEDASSILSPTGPVLESLELIETRFIDDAATGLADSLATYGASLKRFSVVECNLMDKELWALIGGIVQSAENYPESFSLESLDISFNKGRGAVTDQISYLLQVSKLKKLAMGFQAFGEGRRIDLTPILLSLKQNRYLMELDIGGNGIRDDDLPLLVECLLENRGIQVLDLSQNRFTNEGLSFLAQNLIRMPHLVHLLLEDIRDMDQQSILILEDAILQSRNYNIHTIEVAANLMESPAWRRLSCRLDRNWSGVYKFQNEHGEINIPLSLWPLFVKRLCHPHLHGLTARVPDAASILFYLIPGALLPR